ncbi:hypothetical protein [Rasiella sp. SM2506]|uniref:hypothetical protein n=1 Tax=Rasiella sp. SM2506 TaxID=3423914 RepID=UPI003D798CF9
MEYLVRKLPMSQTYISEFIKTESKTIEVLALGSSQVKNAINPDLFKKRTLNLAAGNQHHDTDFKLLKQLLPELPAVKTIIIETSYSHFELPHNGPDFWKNSIYLDYYGANNFERNTYFKDRLIYLSNPKFLSEKAYSYYIEGEKNFGFNRFGYDTLHYAGIFKDLKYDEVKISALKRFKINKEPSLAIFKNNTQLFFKMLDYLEEKGMHVIICEVPMYKTYLPQRVPEILNRRDSIVTLAKERYKNINVFLLETDTVHYNVKDYWNQSHMNPNGAKKFSSALNVFLEKRD